ncbi:MAG TPA: FHA domain-containing protein, partial [Vicinamibacteria bacterium]|nr:FHA domain-containing protein [Vicinamibacteria bacterium]
NDIVLNEDVAVSSEHCRIRPEDGKFVLHDLKSTNGTFVNDRKVTRQALTEGDTIQVGETYLQFRLEHRRS